MGTTPTASRFTLVNGGTSAIAFAVPKHLFVSSSLHTLGGGIRVGA